MKTETTPMMKATPMTEAHEAAQFLCGCHWEDTDIEHVNAGIKVGSQINNELKVILSALELAMGSETCPGDEYERMVRDAFLSIQNIARLADTLAGDSRDEI